MTKIQSSPSHSAANGMQSALETIWTALGGSSTYLRHVNETGEGSLPSAFACSDLAAASVAAAGLALAELTATTFGAMPEIAVDRRLASLWFGTSLRPQGWQIPPAWDAVAGDYHARDGWIRLHTNAPHHRASALAALGLRSARIDKADVAAAVALRNIDELEKTIIAEGGCAAAMRDVSDWQQHPQGMAVAAEPLQHIVPTIRSGRADEIVSAQRPLSGIKVLDLTRVLAGPVATRFLASAGADVLRIDPPWWDEPGVLPEVTPGKCCARLDIKTEPGRATLMSLLAQADILVHGYRPDALARLGLDAQNRERIRPGLIDISLNAYGWTGPWCARRGFDSLVQMSTGIAAAGMRRYGTDTPRPLPVQALDHATGYLLAAAAIRGLTSRLAHGHGSIWRTSLARVADLLVALPVTDEGKEISASLPEDYSETIEQTGWGPALRLNNPLRISGIDLSWNRPAGPLGMDEPRWRTT